MNNYLIIRNEKEIGKLSYEVDLGELNIEIDEEYKPALIRIIKDIINKGEFDSEIEEGSLIVRKATDFLVNCIKQELFLYLEMTVLEEA
jgi:hypothetical protein